MNFEPYILLGMSYAAYRSLLTELAAEGKTTGPKQSESLFKYAQLNQQRMHRIDKTLQLTPELVQAAQQAPAQTWIVISEGWCGDAAQSLPVIAGLTAQSNGNIDLKIVLRDENLELMDQYLTNGGRSIPKLIAVSRETGKELFNWGPRPQPAQELYTQLKAENVSFELASEQLHGWYAKDKTHTLQAELQALLEN